MVRPPRLTLRFAVYAGVALALAGGASVWATRAIATSLAEQQAWTEARHVAEELGRDDLARSLDRPAVGDLRAQLDELFDREALGPGIVRTTLFDREGRVTYSTDHALIGTVAADRAKLDRALAAGHVTGVADGPAGRVLDSWVPVHWLLADRSFPTGVLRVERDYAPVLEEVGDMTRAQAVVTLAALLLLYVSLFPILDRVTRALKDREARVRALTEQASDAILVTDATGRVTEANHQAALFFGSSTLVGTPFGDLVDPGELSRDPLRVDRVLAGEALLRERTFVRGNGRRVVGELNANLLDDGRILVIVRDVTDRKEAERATRRLAAIVESSRDAILALDGDGRIVSWNAAAERVYGWSAEEALGRDVGLLSPPRDEDADVVARMRPGRRAEEFETVHVRRDGTLIDVALTVSPLRAPDGEVAGASLIARDVTAEKQRELELRRAQRAEGTARLAAGVAHDFSNLLTAIAGNADVLLARLPAEDPLRRKAELIQDCAARGAELTRQLSAFGRRPPARPQLVGIAGLLVGLEQSLQRLLGGRVELRTVVDPGVGAVEADPREIEQLVVGLVLHAEESLPAGGVVTVTAANVDFSRRKRASGPDTRVDPGRYVMLSVSDDGGDRAGPETRLGLELAAVFHLVQQRGGTIGVESEPGVGTTVRVYLPLAAAEAPAPAPASPAPAERPREATILVVEDEEVVRALVREILEDGGYAVVEAQDGGAALALLEQGTVDPDLVVTDLLMPGVGGLELAEALRGLRPGCPVIAMSASPTEPVGDLVFLQKPFTHETLAQAVRDALDAVAAGV